MCGSVAVSLGASIALELVRISSAAEAELLNVRIYRTVLCYIILFCVVSRDVV